MIRIEMISFRISATGVWGYDFYDQNRRKTGSVGALVIPNEPVGIHSANCHWYSRFSMDTTIVPGTGRRVKDQRTGEEIYRLIYWGPGLYQIRSDSQSVRVEIREGQYLFGQPGMPVTALTERISDAGWTPPEGSMEAEPWFRTTFFEEVTEQYALMALSFPALRFF